MILSELRDSIDKFITELGDYEVCFEHTSVSEYPNNIRLDHEGGNYAILEQLYNVKQEPEDDCIGCTMCVDCEDCVDCNGCRDCVGCKDCSSCVNCRGCVECVACINCDSCKECMNCTDCYDCSGLVGAVGLTGIHD